MCQSLRMVEKHKALAVFLGDWSAEGTAYGTDRQGGPWRSVHSAHWNVGEYFIVQEEHANGPFDTMSFLGWDPERQSYFSWSIDNLGFANDYLVNVDKNTWHFTGKHARATVTFSDGGRTQTHHWEFNPDGEWVTLCDRVAKRVD